MHEAGAQTKLAKPDFCRDGMVPHQIVPRLACKSPHRVAVPAGEDGAIRDQLVGYTQAFIANVDTAEELEDVLVFIRGNELDRVLRSQAAGGPRRPRPAFAQYPGDAERRRDH